MLAELATAVRERRVSAHELVTTALERIDRLNPALNAVIAMRADTALGEARALDERVASGEDLGPLAGLPLLVKDNTDVVKMRTTNGSRLLADAPIATRDGLVVERLRAAGAIVVGKTNVPEFSFQGFTDNAVFGPTGNPWGLEWSPGGSSGGSGAALAAGMVPLATGTDGGGSVRIPAAFCGLAGLKPTNGLVGRRPIPSWLDFSTDGPFGTSVADVRLLLEIMRGPVAGDPTSLPSWSPGGADVARVIASPRTWDHGPLSEGMERSYQAAIGRIEQDLGIPMETVEPSSIFTNGGNPGEDWFTTVAVEELHFIGRERVLANLERLSPPFRFVMEDALAMTVDDYLGARQRRFRYAREMDELLGEDAVFACPTLGHEGWLADGNLPGTGAPAGGEGFNTGEANLTGHPALSVPAGISANGLPFGLQITGPRFRDDLVLALGAMWEIANPWPAVALGYEPFPLP